MLKQITDKLLEEKVEELIYKSTFSISYEQIYSIFKKEGYIIEECPQLIDQMYKSHRLNVALALFKDLQQIFKLTFDQINNGLNKIYDEFSF